MDEGRPALDQKITFIYTRDLGSSAAFYERVLGLRLALDQKTCRIYHVVGTAYIGVCQRSRPPASTDSLILTLVTQDVDGWYERLLAQGINFEKPPAYNAQYDIYHCFLRDPDGYLIEIQRFNSPFDT